MSAYGSDPSRSKRSAHTPVSFVSLPLEKADVQSEQPASSSAAESIAAESLGEIKLDDEEADESEVAFSNALADFHADGLADIADLEAEGASISPFSLDIESIFNLPTSEISVFAPSDLEHTPSVAPLGNLNKYAGPKVDVATFLAGLQKS